MLLVVRGVIHQQTAHLQKALRDAERRAYLLRSELRYEEAHNSLLRGALAAHGIDEPFAPGGQFPGTP